jgi:hypothetical protein
MYTHSHRLLFSSRMFIFCAHTSPPFLPTHTHLHVFTHTHTQCVLITLLVRGFMVSVYAYTHVCVFYCCVCAMFVCIYYVSVCLHEGCVGRGGEGKLSF